MVVTLTHTEITRYFMTIPEADQLVIEAGAMGQLGGRVCVGYGASGPDHGLR